MFRKVFFSSIVAALVMAAGSVAVFAQNAPVNGTVETVKEDGTRVGVEGVLVEVFRTDIKGGAPSAKTNKKGEFNFAGFPLGSTYILSFSAPGMSPTYMPNVKAGMERLLVTMTPGDGRKLSEEEVRQQAAAPAGAAGASAKEIEDAKKAQAEYEKNKKEIEEKNKKAEATNKIVSEALKAGNDAFAAKNYDLAVAKYDEGIVADPDYVGSAPIFYNNRGIVLRMRGVDSYNASIKTTDVSERVAHQGKARKDFADALDGYLKAWNLMKNAPAADIVDKANFDANKLNTLRGTIDTAQMAVRTEQVDPSVIEATKILIPEYIAIEPDGAKKAAASLAMADLYRVSGDFDNAVNAYKALLESNPDNPDALVGAGLSLVNVGYINNDKTKLQEGANLLQKFTTVAPDTNKFKADAVAVIETLKREQNVTPQKVTTPARKRN